MQIFVHRFLPWSDKIVFKKAVTASNYPRVDLCASFYIIASLVSNLNSRDKLGFSRGFSFRLIHWKEINDEFGGTTETIVGFILFLTSSTQVPQFRNWCYYWSRQCCFFVQSSSIPTKVFARNQLGFLCRYFGSLVFANWNRYPKMPIFSRSLPLYCEWCQNWSHTFQLVTAISFHNPRHISLNGSLTIWRMEKYVCCHFYSYVQRTWCTKRSWMRRYPQVTP